MLRNCFLCFDATGSLLRRIPGQKLILYYPVLTRTSDGEPPIPIAEMVTTDHSAANIQGFLLKLMRDAMKLSPRWKGPKQIEIYMSWALLHATCRAINTITIEQYLIEAWDFANGEIEEWNRFTVHLCASHMIHLFCSKFKTEDRNLKRYVMYCFACLQSCRELDKARDLFKSMSILFSHER